MSEPREFWIETHETIKDKSFGEFRTHGLIWPQVYETDVVPYTIRVIEYLAYAKLHEEIELRKVTHQFQIENINKLQAENEKLKDLYKNKSDQVMRFAEKNDKLQAENKKLRDALEKIAVDYVSEGTLDEDCPSCFYDGRINPKHHEKCIYVLAREALSKTGGEE